MKNILQNNWFILFKNVKVRNDKETQSNYPIIKKSKKNRQLNPMHDTVYNLSQRESSLKAVSVEQFKKKLNKMLIT